MSHSVSDEQFQSLVRLTDEAAMAPRKWSWFLKELSIVAGGPRVQIFSHDIRSGEPLGFHEHGYDPEFLESYRSYYGHMNTWIDGFSALTPGKTTSGSAIVSDSDLEKTEFYNDWIRPQEDIIGSSATILDVGSRRITAIAANVRRVDRDRLEKPLHDLIQRLVPHLQHALKIANLIADLKLENRVLWTGMDPGIAALFILDAKGRVRFANTRGEALSDQGDIVRIDGRSRLRLTDMAANCELSRALHDQQLPRVQISLPFVVRGQRRKQFICRAVPLSEDDGPQPWLGGNTETGCGFTLLILSPILKRINRTPRKTSVG